MSSHFLRSRQTEQEPAWTNKTSATELKKDVLKRIDAFFQSEQHKNTFPFQHEQWENGALRKFSASKICDIACNDLQLKSVRRIAGNQLSKKIQVLTPFQPQFETYVEPIQEVLDITQEDQPSTPSVTQLQEENPDPHHDNPTQSMETNQPSNQATMNTINDLEKQVMDLKSTLDKQTEIIESKFENMFERTIQKVSELIDNKMESIQKSIHDEVQTKIRDEIRNAPNSLNQENLKKFIEDNSKDHINTVIDQQVQGMIQKTKNETATLLNSLTAQIQVEITTRRAQYTQDLISKETSSYKQIASKRDTCILDIERKHTSIIKMLRDEQTSIEKGISDKHAKIIQELNTSHTDLVTDINGEAEQAIQDIEAMVKSNLQNPPVIQVSNAKPPQPVTPNPHATSNMFSNVNLNAPVPSPHQRNQQPWQSNTYTSTITSFHKHVNVKMTKETHILNFYQQLYTQGPAYGIHFRPIEDITIEKSICPDGFTDVQRRQMATTLYQKLSSDDCIGPSFYKAKNIIRQYSSSCDGYKVLFQLLRWVHPNLQQITSNTYDVPKLSTFKGNLFQYGDQITHYIMTQHICNRKFTDVEQAIMFLNNIDDPRYSASKQRALTEIRHSMNPKVPGKLNDPNLLLDSLPTTVEQYQLQADATNRNDAVVRVLTADDITQSSETSSLDGNHAVLHLLRKPFQNRKFPSRKNMNQSQCKACGKWGCNARKCIYTGRLKVALDFIKSNGKIAADLADEYLRINSKRTKMSSIRTLVSLNSDDHMNDDDLLRNYDIEIPMEEIDFQE